jgi:hypothetical protein
MNSPASQEQEIFKRIHNDLVDSFDEELEMEVEDGMLPEWQVPETEAEKDAAKEDRRQAMEAQSDGSRVPPPLGGLHQGEINDVRAHSYRGGSLVGSG